MARKKNASDGQIVGAITALYIGLPIALTAAIAVGMFVAWRHARSMMEREESIQRDLDVLLGRAPGVTQGSQQG